MEPGDRDDALKSLHADTDPAIVATRKGAGGRDLSYVEWHEKLRLVAAVDPAFTWELDPPVFTEVGWNARGTLTVLGVARTGVGFAPHKQTNEDDGSKDAASDAFSRAAAMFGVGLDLYGKARPVANVAKYPAAAAVAPPAAPRETVETHDEPPPRRYAKPARSVGAPEGTAVEAVKERRRAEAFATATDALKHLRALGLSDDEFWQAVRARYGVQSRSDMTVEQFADMAKELRRVGNENTAQRFLDALSAWSSRNPTARIDALRF